MLRLLPILLICALVTGSILFIRQFKKQSLITPTGTQIQQISDSEEKLKSIDAKITTLENRLQDLEKTVNSTKTTKSNVEETVEPTAQTQTIVYAKKAPAYIPLGASGTTTDRNFVLIDTFEVSIDPADYQGYTNMYLEVSLKLFEKVGVASARLFNQTDQSAVASSEVLTESDKFVLLTSAPFKLSPGKKTYRLQSKSEKGYEVKIENARIKVVF